MHATAINLQCGMQNAASLRLVACGYWLVTTLFAECCRLDFSVFGETDEVSLYFHNSAINTCMHDANPYTRLELEVVEV